MKKIINIFVILGLLLNPIINVYAITNNKQIKYEGGTTTQDGITVSKTISPSEIENYFDITLTVETTKKVEETTIPKSVAVVLVIDKSNTMNDSFNGSTSSESKLTKAKESANNFINEFYNYSKDVDVERQVGVVAFNRDATKVAELSSCKTQTEKNNKINEVNKIDAPSKTVNWTNMEAGLSMAYDMLKGSTATNKYIIFLTDGLPTTYSITKNGYEGYTTDSSINGATFNKVSSHINGNFYNIQGDKDIWGTNYSDYGARRAEELAKIIKNNGISIYSIGVGVNSMKDNYSLYALQYITAEGHTIDTDSEANNYNYYKNRYYAIAPGITKSLSEAVKDGTAQTLYHTVEPYKTWLKSYIGSNKYFDSDNASELDKAYNEILSDIKQLSSTEIEASWVANDPMNSNQNETNVIDFIGIYDKNKKLNKSVTLSTTSDNTASYNDKTDTISWDLKKSNYTEITKDNIKYYTYKLTYRIRLKNEQTNFSYNTSLNTNGTTTLTYLIKESNKDPVQKEINFKIPKVEGYKSKLEFTKLSNYGNTPLEGVKFELIHDENCPCMHELKHIDENYKLEATSNKSGKVVFNNIPSGHNYILHELETDTFHELDQNNYNVTVSYGNTTTTLVNNTLINNVLTKNLLITKTVEGVKSNKTFKFEINATYHNTPLTGTYNIIKNNQEEDTITFIDGKANINLKHNETILITNLPYTSKLTINELNKDGFIVKYQINDNQTKLLETTLENIELTTDTTINFTNISGYILPKTGSSLNIILVATGTIFITIPVLYILKERRKNNEKNN